MNQYVKFIVRVLLTCFFIAFLGGIIQVSCGLQQYIWGLDVGHFYNGTILTQSCLA